MLECALVQQMHTVNTYVSCQSSLHSNSQHSNTRLHRSTTSEVGCFHGNQAAAFDDGSHEMAPADNAGSSEALRGRMDGRVGSVLGKLGKEKAIGNYFSQKMSHVHHRRARLSFPATVVYLAPRQAAAGTLYTR